MEEKNRVRVSCLGPEGSYSQLAARKMCEGGEVLLCKNFTEVVSKLLKGECEFCVLPVENSLNGGVGECLDLLEREEIFGVKEYVLPVDHRLATLMGVKREDIRLIRSHEQALSQCSEYLAENFPEASYVSAFSTSESLSGLDAHTAGIVGSHVVREGIVLSEENIADNKSNFTRFLLLERGRGNAEHSAMVFFCAVCPHSPGSLLGLLKIFRKYELNLTRIESRPVKETFGQYRFFIEFAGDVGSARVLQALGAAKAYCAQFKVLGAYQ